MFHVSDSLFTVETENHQTLRSRCEGIPTPLTFPFISLLDLEEGRKDNSLPKTGIDQFVFALRVLGDVLVIIMVFAEGQFRLFWFVQVFF